ncbi:hypothetical protein Q4E93_01900 [Flavitalea sp. BT771]|uniref:hypothetical protein n=1 Tax=Flavitalea sp. BT771 TaxID=3063329 RepID=UPI0026E45D54|nr:hypothetical protein [Flavitalea sp. BT771]MDO6429322.1 hypothetical protein [Flavitalea sp. BT771]MDV6218550.1 hypothetical protein [Flavitalea sp. BT771]
MKHVDFLYFNLYNYFYRTSQLRPSFNPRMQTMYLFSLGSGGWILLLESLYLHLVKHGRFASKGESTFFAVAIYMLTAVLFHYIFIFKDRDQKIFGKYERQSNKHPMRRWHFAISISVLFLPYVGLLALAIIFPRH